MNVSVDGKYRLSLDVWQVTELGLRNGAEMTEEELAKWEEESAFGKLYARALEYTMIRPHSAKEIRDYLWRKTLTRKQRVTSHESRVTKDAAYNKKSSGGDNANRTSYLVPRTSLVVIEKPGVSQVIADRVYARLVDKGYIDDEKFTRYWLENRSLTKGASQRKLIAELRGKGVEQGIIASLLPSSARNDADELQKIIAKKARNYDDPRKFVQYLMRQGFRYDDIRSVLNDESYDSESAGS
ncbi:MAG: regulatory protein RecX [Candidatus Saccharimonadales bacterium]